MIYGLTRRAFVEDGPAIAAMDVGTPLHRPLLAGPRCERRLELVDCALNPANDACADLPIAL